VARAQTGRPDLAGEEPSGGFLLIALLRSMRPKQWAKNVLVAAAPGAAHLLFHARIAEKTAVAFVVFCLAASGSYLLNDVRDLDADRNHPTKRFRPIASGVLPIPIALGAAGGLIGVAMVIALLLSLKFAALVAAYLAVTLAYSMWLKHEPVLDIAIVASGFVFRAVAGGVATHIPLSQWFLIVTAAGSMFVVAGKRHGEFVEMGEDRGSTRASLLTYDLPYLRFVWIMSSGIAIVAYCLWAFEQTHLHAFPWFELSIVPFVLALLRYALIIEAGHASAPEDVLLRDRVLLIISAAWLVVYGIGVYVAK
jgi:decaprenyl-phosphate phosphoribosyltransferase